MTRPRYQYQELTDIHCINTRIELSDNVPPPCIGCISAHRCATQSLACKDFLRYVQLREGEPLAKLRIPSRHYYNRIYKMHDYGLVSSDDSEASSEATEFNPANSDFARC